MHYQRPSLSLDNTQESLDMPLNSCHRRSLFCHCFPIAWANAILVLVSLFFSPLLHLLSLASRFDLINIQTFTHTVSFDNLSMSQRIDFFSFVLFSPLSINRKSWSFNEEKKISALSSSSYHHCHHHPTHSSMILTLSHIFIFKYSFRQTQSRRIISTR
jgi:hypothetical protein